MQKDTPAPYPYTMPLVFHTHPLLHRVVKEVPYEQSLSKILPFMLAAMSNHPEGLGLAANQIGIDARVIIFLLDAEHTKAITLVNPVITKRRGGTVRKREGCLSYPNQIVKMTRYKEITVTGFNERWKRVTFTLRGLPAKIVQHEIDHLNGITIKTKK